MRFLKLPIGLLILAAFLIGTALLSLKRALCGQPMPYDTEEDAA